MYTETDYKQIEELIIKEDELNAMQNIVGAFDVKNETLSHFYFFEEILALRASLSIIYPNLKFKNDKDIYEILENKTKIYKDEEDLDNYINTMLHRKIIFPEKYFDTQQELNQYSIFETLVEELKELNQYNYIAEIYYLAKNIKLLYPNEFKNLDLLKILGTNAWISNIARELKNTPPEDYAYELIEISYCINILGYPGNIIFDKNDWEKIEDYGNILKKENDLICLADYAMKMKIISAREVEIENEKINLIF